jgi:Zn-dependent peptidase ImmA (M78 family)
MAGRKQAEKDALELLEESWDGELPVDPVRIAKDLGLEVIGVSFKKDVSGALVKKEGEADPTILLNKQDGRTRKRFSCAHELGHYILRSAEPKPRYEYVDYRDRNSSTGTIEEELYANSFAASLLMPEPAVRALHERGLPAFRLAKKFGVSPEAMANRLDNLHLS